MLIPDLPPALQVLLNHFNDHAPLQVNLVLIPRRVRVNHSVLLFCTSGKKNKKLVYDENATSATKMESSKESISVGELCTPVEPEPVNSNCMQCSA